MTKKEFLNSLREKLYGLGELEIEERVLFYSEMIDDRMEEGLTEEEAVAELGPIDDIPGFTAVKTPDKKAFSGKKLKVWVIIMLVLGAPIWLSLLIAAVSVLISAYAAVWAVIITLWAIWGSLIAVAAGGFFASVVFFAQGHIMQALAVLGGSLFCGGIAIFGFFGINALDNGVILLTKKIALWIRSLFVRKEEVK